MRIPTILAATAALSLTAVPAAGQIQAGNLVNVNVSQVMVENILNNNNINVDVTAPVTVQLPISLAANVCVESVNVLAQQKKQGGTMTCNATSQSDALSEQVLRIFRAQQQ